MVEDGATLLGPVPPHLDKGSHIQLDKEKDPSIHYFLSLPGLVDASERAASFQSHVMIALLPGGWVSVHRVSRLPLDHSDDCSLPCLNVPSLLTVLPPSLPLCSISSHCALTLSHLHFFFSCLSMSFCPTVKFKWCNVFIFCNLLLINATVNKVFCIFLFVITTKS